MLVYTNYLHIPREQGCGSLVRCIFPVLLMTLACGFFEFRWWEGIVAEINDLDPTKATVYFPGLNPYA